MHGAICAAERDARSGHVATAATVATAAAAAAAAAIAVAAAPSGIAAVAAAVLSAVDAHVNVRPPVKFPPSWPRCHCRNFPHAGGSRLRCRIQKFGLARTAVHTSSCATSIALQQGVSMQDIASAVQEHCNTVEAWCVNFEKVSSKELPTALAQAQKQERWGDVHALCRGWWDQCCLLQVSL
jgi:hypothetical protein